MKRLAIVRQGHRRIAAQKAPKSPPGKTTSRAIQEQESNDYILLKNFLRKKKEKKDFLHFFVNSMIG